ncbi:hypothetical protein [Saccharothrix australiensis]|uniref:Uncharacterized protein n=1 Tax=Saccharothrix australiensis TaxID=2072 RepID=A0A495VZI0_9PSEU|nr:hypothetical protein [Saccharothrix australiensis]RKT54746.1 hypothetical protein C8E97_3394 [Saccharothrix australiensis]
MPGGAPTGGGSFTEPVVADARAPGGLVLFAPRLAAEPRHLASVLGVVPAADGDDRARGVHALLAAARAAVAAGAALVADYA